MSNINADTNMSSSTTPPPSIPIIPIPKIPPSESFGSCLLMKNDNDFLVEFLAYHYVVLPLRYVYIVSDDDVQNNNDDENNSDDVEDPNDVLDRWRNRNRSRSNNNDNSSDSSSSSSTTTTTTSTSTDLLFDDFDLLNGVEVMKLSELVNQSVTNGDYPPPPPPPKRSTNPMGYLVYKQKLMLYHCFTYMQRHGVRYVTTTDTDEFIVINHHLLSDHEEQHHRRQTLSQEKFEERYSNLRRANMTPPPLPSSPSLPGTNQNNNNNTVTTTVVDVLKRLEKENITTTSACTLVPRLKIGVIQDKICPQSLQARQYAMSNFPSFNDTNYRWTSGKPIWATLRYQQHQVPDRPKMLPTKTILDFSKILLPTKNVTNIDELMKRDRKNWNINTHRPFSQYCPHPQLAIKKSPFVAFHYAGPYERLHRPAMSTSTTTTVQAQVQVPNTTPNNNNNNTKNVGVAKTTTQTQTYTTTNFIRPHRNRGYEDWKVDRGHVSDSMSLTCTTKNEIHNWIFKFVDQIPGGLQRAQYLLQ